MFVLKSTRVLSTQKHQHSQLAKIVSSWLSFNQTNNYATEVTMELKPYKLHRLDSGPPAEAKVTKDEAIDMYKKMQVIRRLETSAGNLYKEKLVRGFCHLYSGQEACAVGMGQVLRPQDTVITAYRAHGWTYIMGATPVEVLAELAGKKSGCARGKGGSMHMYARNFYGGNGIVGAQVPLGAGLAFSHKYTGNGGVSLSLYGDGAANQGQVFEAYNMAKLWNLPSIFICENNGYGMGTSIDRAAASTTYYTRGDYIPGIWIDGMDVVGVREGMRWALDYCSSGKGPLVMEIATYRYHGHSMSDPGTSYRTRDEIQEVRQTRDPITSFRERIISAELATPEELKKIDTEVRQVIDEAVKKAKSDSEIAMDEIAADIYATNLESSIRGLNVVEQLTHKRIGAAQNFQ